jgi:glycosyltransferase involved in cell wall biosynthesis
MNWTFYCTHSEPGSLDWLAEQYGAEVMFSPVPIKKTIAFIASLRKVLAEGDYDILHCHHDLLSALYLVADVGLKKKRRFVHVHNADLEVATNRPIKRKVLRIIFRCVCGLLADKIIGISKHTIETFCKGCYFAQKKKTILYYGIDDPVRDRWLSREALRDQLGFPPGAKIVLFAGRIVPEKNPLYAVDVISEMNKIDPTVMGIFVGAGSEESAVQERIKSHFLDRSCKMLGWRDDVASVMSACDWFILPRPENPMEGFGIAVVEAQLSGLRLLLSRGIADDPLLRSASYSRLPLDAGPKKWAEQALKMFRETAPSVDEARSDLIGSDFDMSKSLENLQRLYTQELK